MHDVAFGPILIFVLIALVLFGGLILLLGTIAFAAGRATRGDGEGKRGCLGGCGLVAVLLFLCLLGVVGCATLCVFAAGVTAVAANPIESIEWERHRLERVPEDRIRREYPATLRFEVRGETGNELIDFLSQLIDHDLDYTRRRITKNGDEITEYLIGLPVTEYELRDIEDEIARELELRIHLPDSVKIRFKGRDFGF